VVAHPVEDQRELLAAALRDERWGVQAEELEAAILAVQGPAGKAAEKEEKQHEQLKKRAASDLRQVPTSMRRSLQEAKAAGAKSDVEVPLSQRRRRADIHTVDGTGYAEGSGSSRGETPKEKRAMVLRCRTYKRISPCVVDSLSNPCCSARSGPNVSCSTCRVLKAVAAARQRPGSEQALVDAIRVCDTKVSSRLPSLCLPHTLFSPLMIRCSNDLRACDTKLALNESAIVDQAPSRLELGDASRSLLLTPQVLSAVHPEVLLPQVTCIPRSARRRSCRRRAPSPRPDACLPHCPARCHGTVL